MGFGGKEAKHPSAFDSMKWINAAPCGRQQMSMCLYVYECARQRVCLRRNWRNTIASC